MSKKLIPIPTNNYILCEKVQDSHDTTEDGVFFQKEELPIFKIKKISRKIKTSLYKIDDYVIIKSTGTKIKLNENDEYYLINFNDLCGIII